MESGIGQGRGEGRKILEEALLMGFEEGFYMFLFLGVRGQVGDHKKSRQGAGRPSIVLGLERPTHFRHNNK